MTTDSTNAQAEYEALAPNPDLKSLDYEVDDEALTI